MRVKISIEVYAGEHDWTTLVDADVSVTAPSGVLEDVDWGSVASPLVRRALVDAHAEIAKQEAEEVEGE